MLLGYHDRSSCCMKSDIRDMVLQHISCFMVLRVLKRYLSSVAVRPSAAKDVQQQKYILDLCEMLLLVQ
jgi:hypothetical protein